MNKLHTAVCTAVLLCLPFVSASAQAQNLSPVQEEVAAAMKMDYRSEAEIARDENRNPVQALEFMGLKQDSKVIELFPAGQAWYSKVIAPVIADQGELYLIDSTRTFESWGDLLEQPVFKNTHKLPVEAGYNRSEGRYEIGELNVPVDDADLFLNIREYHNFNLADKTRINQAAFDALKPGGRYVIIDHSRRHMQAESRTLGRREDPVQVILEVQNAGFQLEKSSNMFLSEADDLSLEVGNEAVTGQTDRFFLVFKKPE